MFPDDKVEMMMFGQCGVGSLGTYSRVAHKEGGAVKSQAQAG